MWNCGNVVGDIYMICYEGAPPGEVGFILTSASATDTNDIQKPQNHRLFSNSLCTTEFLYFVNVCYILKIQPSCRLSVYPVEKRQHLVGSSARGNVVDLRCARCTQLHNAWSLCQTTAA